MKKVWMSLIGLAAMATASQAAEITWGVTGTDKYWEDGANWVGGVAPVSGDSVELGDGTGNYDVRLNSAFTIRSNQYLKATNPISVSHPELVLEANAALTLATGGTMDVAFLRTRYSDGAQLIVEFGASVAIDSFNTAAIGSLKFIADANGVSTLGAGAFTVSSTTTRYWNLDVDLTNYNQANGDIVLVDYDTLSGTFATFAANGQTVTFSDGWTADIDYDYNGEGKIALTNVIPEPATLGLIASISIGLMVVRRFQI